MRHSSAVPPVRLFAAALACLAAAGPAAAQEAPPVDDGGDRLSIGTGIATVPSYEGSDSNILIPEFVLRGRVSGFNFFSRGPMLFVDLVRDPETPRGWDIGAGPVAGIRLDRTLRIRDARVRALGELDVAIELGGWAGVTKTGVITSDYDLLSVRVSAAADVAGAHGGWIVTPTIEYGTPLSKRTFVGFSVLADWVDRDYGDYYFDVSAAGAAASGLSVYAGGGAGFKRAGVNLLATHAITGDLTKGLSAIGVVGYYRMLGDAKRSPVVREAGSPNQWIGGLGLTWSF